MMELKYIYSKKKPHNTFKLGQKEYNFKIPNNPTFINPNRNLDCILT